MEFFWHRKRQHPILTNFIDEFSKQTIIPVACLLILVNISFFGVLFFLSLYPGELRQKRLKFKPGLVPPYYADLPKSFDEIMESERRYLDSKESHPYTTDIKYFSRAVINILFRNARSQ